MSRSGGFLWAFGWMAFACTTAHAEDCSESTVHIQRAEADVVNFYLADAAGYANAAVESYGCSEAASAPEVARLMHVLAMIRLFNEDDAGAGAAFRTARSLDSQTWNTDYGDTAKAIFDAAKAPEEEAPGTLVLKGLGEAWVAVDGTVQGAPVTVSAGLHLVQVGLGEVASFARIVAVQPGANVVVSVPQSGEIPLNEPNRGEPAPVWLHLAGGAVAASGQGLTVAQGAQTLQEPAFKVALGVEAGAGFSVEKFWFRGTVGLEPMFGGSYLYAADATDWRGTAVAVIGRFDVGTELAGLRVGLGSGMSWPGRIPLLGMAAIPMGGSGVTLEPRAGIRLATARAVEPIGSISLAWSTK